MQLTKHFHLHEFIKSDTAAKLGIDNKPEFRDVLNLMYLSLKLERVREVCYNSPIIITSGFRNLPLNRAVGGSETSDHMRGLAADFKFISSANIKVLYNRIKQSSLTFDQLILYNTFMHIGLGEKNRRLCFDKSGK